MEEHDLEQGSLRNIALLEDILKMLADINKVGGMNLGLEIRPGDAKTNFVFIVVTHNYIDVKRLEHHEKLDIKGVRKKLQKTIDEKILEYENARESLNILDKHRGE